MPILKLELVRPELLVGLAALPVLAWYFRRSLVDLPLRQRLASLGVRSLLVVLLLLALADLTLLTPTSRMFVVFVCDESQSIDETARQAAAQYIAEARRHSGMNRSAVLHFAEEPSAIQELPSADPEAMGTTNKRGTNLAAAIEAAVACIPPFYVPKLVVLSDGNETVGDAVQAALAVHTPIDTIPLAPRSDPEVQVTAVHVPAQAREGEPFFVEVVIDSNHEDAGRIEIFKGAARLDAENQGQTHNIKQGENRFRFRQTVGEDRRAEFIVRIDGFQDTLLDNNQASGQVFASGKPRVLLIDSEPSLARDLVWALREHDVSVDARPPGGLPDTLAELQSFEALLLSNVPATALTTRQMEAVRTYVQELGGGFVMLGGDQSFGLGGYYKSILEEVLPVRSDFEKEKEKPSLALVLAIDKSGSMGGQKIELAKTAAQGAVELLHSRDQIGVIAFDAASYWVSELRSAADREHLLQRIRGIEASGGTALLPAMEMASDALTPAAAKLKHVILLTDGISSPGDLVGAAERMAAEGITVSAVGIGQGAHQSVLEQIARTGRGRHYVCQDPQAVPQIFAKETITASRSAIHEIPFLPRLVRPSPALRTIDLEAAPFLLGYVATRPKPTSEVILASESGEPVLAWWRYGLGMSAAFTSDAHSRWAAEWLAWPEFGKFWAQVIRHVMRTSASGNVFVEIERRGSKVEVVLDAVDEHGTFRNQVATDLTIIDPHLGRRELAMSQSAPGRYRAEFDAVDEGTYYLEVAHESSPGTVVRQSRGVSIGYPDELRLKPANELLLKQISSVSEGTYDPAPESVFDPQLRTVLLAEPLWPYLLSIALGVFVLDVALRRIQFSRASGSSVQIS